MVLSFWGWESKSTPILNPWLHCSWGFFYAQKSESIKLQQPFVILCKYRAFYIYLGIKLTNKRITFIPSLGNIEIKTGMFNFNKMEKPFRTEINQNTQEKTEYYEGFYVFTRRNVMRN